MKTSGKKKLLRLLDKTEAIWRRTTWEVLCHKWIKDTGCPICVYFDYKCDRCIVTKTFVSCDPIVAKANASHSRCDPIVAKANASHSRRPVYDAIRKMRKWVEKQEPGGD